jgi:signal transduction histidine kinase
MTARGLGTLLDEPRPVGAPSRVWRDWVLVAVIVVASLLEGALRSGLVWRPIAVVWSIVFSLTLLWRRTHPLLVVVIAFGASALLHVIEIVTQPSAAIGLGTMVWVLVLVYSLCRWGSGREIAIGALVIAVSYVLGIVSAHTVARDAALGVVVVALPAVLGIAVRYRESSRAREIEQARMREREQLARDLHDTVAHHVSAMVVRAQAGRVVGASDSAAAVDALEVIEAEGSRTLAEMRALVGVLRDGAPAGREPVGGLTDIASLADADGIPRVDVRLEGEVSDVDAAVGAAAFRIAQESVTNARRHSHGATAVDVVVTGVRDAVVVRVVDDGAKADPARGAGSGGGFGIVGMTERSRLLGGTFTAGPGADRGWVVEARLPRRGPAS